MITHRPAETWENTAHGVTLGLHQSRAESGPHPPPPPLFFPQNENRNVSALKHVHDTDLFFLTTVKRTGLELVPNSAEQPPSLVC